MIEAVEVVVEEGEEEEVEVVVVAVPITHPEPPPQAYTVPAAVHAKAWRRPHATCVTTHGDGDGDGDGNGDGDDGVTICGNNTFVRRPQPLLPNFPAPQETTCNGVTMDMTTEEVTRQQKRSRDAQLNALQYAITAPLPTWWSQRRSLSQQRHTPRLCK